MPCTKMPLFALLLAIAVHEGTVGQKDEDFIHIQGLERSASIKDNTEGKWGNSLNGIPYVHMFYIEDVQLQLGFGTGLWKSHSPD